MTLQCIETLTVFITHLLTHRWELVVRCVHNLLIHIVYHLEKTANDIQLQTLKLRNDWIKKKDKKIYAKDKEEGSTSWLDMKFQMPSQARIIHSSVVGLMSRTFKSDDLVEVRQYSSHWFHFKPWHLAVARSSARSRRATPRVCRRGHLKVNKLS